jgi:putative thioredoxin
MSEIIGAGAVQDSPDLIKDGSIETFEADVLQASMSRPVVVDFWAPWCGPCKTLGPLLEKVVRAANGAVAMVKIDIDKNQMLASQMRIQSVPTVYAFYQGRPVDGFQGAVPESQIKQFVERLVTMAPASASENIDDMLSQAEAALLGGDAATAAAAFAEIAEMSNGDDGPDVRAMAGLARAYISLNEPDQARKIMEAVPEDQRRNSAFDPVRAALELAATDTDNEELEDRRKAAEAAPEDYQRQFDYAEALIGAGRMEEGAGILLSIIAAEREWNDGAAKAKLLTLFDALGPTNQITVRARRRLSSILFS